MAAGGTASLILDKDKQERPLHSFVQTYGIVAITIAGIILQDKILQQMFVRGWVRAIVQPTIYLHAIYYTGFALSYAIDDEEGIRNYHSFLRLAKSNPVTAIEVTIQSVVIVTEHLTSPEVRKKTAEDWDAGIQELERRYEPLISAFTP